MGPGGTPYCTPSNLANYLPQSALNLASSALQQQVCLDATEQADSYLRGRYQLPMLAWGNDLTMYTTWIACFLLMTQIGFQPTAGSDSVIRERYYMAVGWPDRNDTGWFPRVQRQSVHPDVTPTVAQPGDPVHDLPQVITSAPRGWQQYRGGKPVI